MDCKEIRPLLAADVDGELDLVRHLEIEQHLRACPDCARAAASLRAQRAALQANLPRFTAPSRLADKIRASLRTEASAPATAPATTQAVATATRPPTKIVSFPSWQLGALAASLAIALFAGFQWGTARAHGDLLVDEAVANHVR